MSDARLPRQFGKYTLLRPLARGGMGELYLACVGDLGGAEKLCVIKKLPDTEPAHRVPGSPRPEAMHTRRLLDEARVMVRLNHVNLVQVFDSGVVDGELYLAMELVAGRDLRAAWNRCADLRARIPVDMALYVVREVARGLAYAHGYGGLALVHRDVAPPNLLLSWQGEVKITDFGLAASRLKSERTGPGIVFGRIGYLSPEQARGEKADRRTDIYALGVILWELLTGRPLIDPMQDPAETLRWIRSAEPEPPTRYATDLPESLAAVVMRAIAPRREDRFATADELRQAVSRELLRMYPDADAGCVVTFLRGLYGDEIDEEQVEHERLLREELPRVRAVMAQRPGAPQPAAHTPVGIGLSPPGEGPQAPRVLGDDAGDDAEQRIGALIDGRYRLDRLLGMGGMGAVYEGEHVAIRKKVAVKVLHRAFSQQADLVTRFRREAQAVSRIGHPNIVNVTDFGYTQDGCAYLVMEHLHGMDLGQLLEKQVRLPWERAIPIAVQLVQALGAAHAVGIIHRDLKPENIYLVDPLDAVQSGEATRPRDQQPRSSSGSRDQVKVLDFGIAMRLEPSVPIRLTLPGLTVGTPEYMAPEQGTGEAVDARADVYAVGTILFEMLLGRLPFTGSSIPELFGRKLNEAPPAPRSLDPGISVGLSRLVVRCLARNPAARPQTMNELSRGLHEVHAELLAMAAEAVLVEAEATPTRLPLAGDATQSIDLAASPPPEGAPASASTARGVQGPGRVGENSEAAGGPAGDAPDAALAADGFPGHSVLEISYEPGVTVDGKGAEAPPVGLHAGSPVWSGQSLSGASARSVPGVPRWQLYAMGGAAVILLVAVSLAGTRMLATTTTTDAGRSVVRTVDAGAPREARPARGDKPEKGEGRPSSVAGPEAAMIEWARRAADNGRYLAPKGDNLVELLERIEQVTPRHPEALRLREQAVDKVSERGKDALRRKDLEEALTSYRILSALKAEEPFPRSELSHQLQVQARAQNRGRTRARALELAQGAVEVTPDSVPARLALGDVYLGLAQREQAAGEYRRVLGMHPYPEEERAAQAGLVKAGGAAKRRKPR